MTLTSRKSAIDFERRPFLCRRGAAAGFVLLTPLLLAACATSTTEVHSKPQPPSHTPTPVPPRVPAALSQKAARDGVLIPGTGVFVHAPPGVRRARVPPASGFQLDFVNTDIKTVATAVLTQGLGLPVVIDPGVSGVMSLQSDQPLNASQAMASLELALRPMGFVLVKVSGVFHLMPAQNAVRQTEGLNLSDDLRPGFGVYVVPLKFVSAQEMATLVKPFAPEGAVVHVDSARNLLVLSGTDQEIAALTSMVRMFDVNWLAGMSFALYPVQYTSTNTLASELSKVFSGPNSPIAGMVRFVPLKSINSLLVVTPQPKYLPLVDSWIKRLDTGSLTPGRHLYVYEVQNGRASDLATSLEEIFGLPMTPASTPQGSSDVQGFAGTQSTSSPVNYGQSSNSLGFGSSTSVQGLSPASAGGSPGALSNAPFGTFNGGGASISAAGSAPASASTTGLRIVPDLDNNSILIYATAGDFRMISAALKRLDVLPIEVVIDASIVEVTLNDQLQYGLNFSYQSSHGPITFSDAASGAIAQQFPGLSFLYTGGTKITSVLNALESITNVRVLSSPKLVVLNNHDAQLEVGDEVPIVTQTSVSTVDSSAPIVNSVQMLNTGVILEVVPRANESGQVLLDLSQEVSDVVPTTTSSIDSPTVEQRQISTTVAVHDGDTIVLGGLIQDSKSLTRSGIPYLRSLPVIGDLFGTTNHTDTRTELIVLLTPHVVRSPRQMDAAMEDMRQQFGELRNRIPK